MASRNDAMPHGMVTISRQQINPASAYASQSQRPLKMNQMMLSNVRMGSILAAGRWWTNR